MKLEEHLCETLHRPQNPAPGANTEWFVLSRIQTPVGERIGGCLSVGDSMWPTLSFCHSEICRVLRTRIPGRAVAHPLSG